MAFCNPNSGQDWFLQRMVKMDFQLHLYTKVLNCHKWIPSYFLSKEKRLRQGGSLSPFLFIGMVDALSREINRQKEQGLLELGIKILQDFPTFSHQMFVDDNLLYGSSSINKPRRIKKGFNRLFRRIKTNNKQKQIKYFLL